MWTDQRFNIDQRRYLIIAIALLFFSLTGCAAHQTSAVISDRAEVARELSRADLAAILVTDLKITEYAAARQPVRYQGRFRPPAVGSSASGETAGRPEPGPPADLAGEPRREEILAVLKLGLRGLELFPDGLFHPREPVSRANFALAMEDLLSRIKGEPLLPRAFVGNVSPFPDVAGDHYAFNAIMVSTTRNILSADLDGAFRPEQGVSGTEALAAVWRLRDEIKKQQVTYRE